MGNKGSAEKPAAGVPAQPHYRAHDLAFMGDKCAWKPDLSLTEGDKLMFKIEEICTSFMNVGGPQQELGKKQGLILDVRGSGSNLEAYEGNRTPPIPRFDLWTNVFEPTDPRRVIEFRLRNPNVFFRLKEMSREEVNKNIKPMLEDRFNRNAYKKMASTFNRTNAWFSLTGRCEPDGQEWTAGICARISMVKHDKPKPAEEPEKPARGKAAFSSKEIAQQRKNLNKSDGKKQAAKPSASQRKAMQIQMEIDALKLRTRDTSEPADPSDAQRRANELKESSTKWKSNLKKTETRASKKDLGKVDVGDQLAGLLRGRRHWEETAEANETAPTNV